MDDALKKLPVGATPPVDLRTDIMRSVRAAQRARQTAPVAAAARYDFGFAALFRGLAWTGAVAATAMLALAFWPRASVPAPLVWTVASVPEPLPTPPSLRDVGELLARSAPASVVSPLTDELARLEKDLDRTQRFILASLP